MITHEFLERLRGEAANQGVLEIVVGAFIIRSGKFLIVKRAAEEKFLAGFDEIPSGHLDAGEAIGQGLIREVEEETNLQVRSIVSYANSFDYESKSGKLTRQFNFFVEIGDGEVKLTPEEHCGYVWDHPSSSSFPSLNLSEKTRECIVDAAKMRSLEAF